MALSMSFARCVARRTAYESHSSDTLCFSELSVDLEEHVLNFSKRPLGGVGGMAARVRLPERCRTVSSPHVARSKVAEWLPPTLLWKLRFGPTSANSGLASPPKTSANSWWSNWAQGGSSPCRLSSAHCIASRARTGSAAAPILSPGRCRAQALAGGSAARAPR